MTQQDKIEGSAQADNSAILPSHEGEKYWTENRLELWRWFQRHARSLGEIYLGAVKMIYRPIFPGRTRFVSHAVREIRNRLPDIISGVKNAPSVQYANKLDEISRVWEKAGLPLDGSLPISVTASETLPSSSIPLPRKLFKRISVLIKEHNDAREKPIDAAKRLFSGTSPENLDLGDTLRPVVDQWLAVTDWFMKKVHDSGTVDKDVNGKEFKNQFELFEAALGALLRGFFATIEELDEILEDANS